MIPRYSREEMAQLWAEEAKYQLWYEIEVSVCEAWAALGVVPAEAVTALRERGRWSPERIAAIEREVRHDVLAFLTDLGENVGEPHARHIHRGLTSSDILDTALAVRLSRAGDLLIAGVDRLLDALHRRAMEHKDTVCVGRSHGIHGEPTTFGLKLAGFHAEMQRARRRLEAAKAEIATCALSGAVGTYATVDPRVEAMVAEKLGLAVEPVSTQVIPRDRHAAFMAAVGVVAASLERLAVEIRHLQRSEVREVEEAFGSGQKGSSAMPHKRNPVLSENITGLARLIRAQVTPALENVALWHERDISHSSVERVSLPDATIALDFALHRMAGLIEQMVVYPEAMTANLNRLGGLVYSQGVLLALVETGMARERAYERVQAAAMRVWDDPARGPAAFRQALRADPVVDEALPGEALDRLFDPAAYSRHVDTIFARVFARGSGAY